MMLPPHRHHAYTWSKADTVLEIISGLLCYSWPFWLAITLIIAHR
jgi:hypothetical protein